MYYFEFKLTFKTEADSNTKRTIEELLHEDVQSAMYHAYIMKAFVHQLELTENRIISSISSALRRKLRV